jgi:hypothetical protein
VYVPGTPCTNIESTLWAVKDFLVYVTEEIIEGKEDAHAGTDKFRI